LIIQAIYNQDLLIQKQIGSNNYFLKIIGLKYKKYFLLIFSFVLLFSGIGADKLYAQAEMTPWGNLNGIRIDGQLMKFGTSMCLIGPSMMEVKATAREKQHPAYYRNGKKQIVTTEISKFAFTEVVQDTLNDMVKINIEVTAAADTTGAGAFICFDLPADEFHGAVIKLIDSTISRLEPISLIPATMGRIPKTVRLTDFFVQASVKGFRVESTTRSIEVRTEGFTELILLKGNMRFGNPNDRIFLGILPGHTQNGQTTDKSFLVKVSGEIDRTPVKISFDPRKPGKEFDGLGGNFRIQNDTLDPLIIDYCLNNLSVKWARVEMPWRSWHPIESINPLDAARAGKIADNVRIAMEMAQKFSRQHIPFIMSVWYPPVWAVVGELNYRDTNGVFGNPLNPKKMRSIIKSIGDYFVYLKEAYGVEPDLFSFNESDLGINVRMTGQEHADFIKKLGTYLASKELKTKMLLGDNSDANSIDFIEPALQDPAALRFIGAISFHTWRGCDNWTLSNWADASNELNVPLIIGEGGTDAQAFGYPDIFSEPSFAMDEIDIYVRSCNVAHVKSILQWQLTSDYSLLTGGGTYGTKGPLQPTQRFWNMKQLGLVAPGSYILPVICDNDIISCAAFSDIANGIYTVHLVNQGPSRPVILTGFPDNVKELQLYVTDNKQGMKEGKRVHVKDGIAKFTIGAFGFTSLINVK
jgi:hypothetical protein